MNKLDLHLDITRKLLGYSAAGAAAALTAGPAQGAIIANTTPQNFNVAIGSFANINFDSAGIDEFSIRGFRSASSSFSTTTFGFLALYKNDNLFAHVEDPVAGGASSGNPNALPVGFLVGPAAVFDAIEGGDTLATTYYFSPAGGPFSQFAGEVRYLGTRFVLGGNTHYGWIAVRLNTDLLSGVVEGYAYEACADTAIATGATSGGANCGRPGDVPEPSSLALMAAGAAGLFALRRRKSA
jgi:hypothetical protein